ncbi:MAG: WD40 repeat domain-containing protein [Anaerolineae bacterium]|nr:WD40 repeat domain-containing protein [Anaerolineae bacterium]
MSITRCGWINLKVFLSLVVAVPLLVWHRHFPVTASDTTEPAIVALSISPMNPHYATVRQNGLVEIVDYQTGVVINTYTIPLPFQDVNNLNPTGYNVVDIAYSPLGNPIAVVIADISISGIIYLLDWETGEVRPAYNQTYLRRINDIGWSPDGNRIVLALQDGGADQLILSRIAILNVTTGEMERTLLDAESIDNYAVTVVAWSASNVIGYANRSELILWDATTSMELGSLSASDEIYDAVWDPQANRIATLNEDRTIQVWDVTAIPYALEQSWQMRSDRFRSRGMSWIGENILAVNLWTDVEVWNVTDATLEGVIESDLFVNGLGALPNNEILIAGPQSVTAYQVLSETPSPKTSP